MRHGKAGYKLGRTSSHREATLRNLAASLFEHGQIVTTIPRAKAVQPFIEKIVTKAKAGSLHARRQVIAKLGWDRPAFEWLYIAKAASDQVERNRYGELRKAPKLVKHIFDHVAPRFKDRNGGYTRIVKLGKHRIGDGGELCVLQFVGAEQGPEIGAGGTSQRKAIANRRKAFAKTLAQPKS
jgi:large subunit ribosomal protein L17